MNETERAAPGLDELLDSVHPGCYIDGMKYIDRQWYVWLMWPGWMWDERRGTGPTRMLAIKNAVENARIREETP